MVSDTFYTFKAVLKVTEHLSVQVKTGPFAEHSNQLWNISGVPTWSKVNAGLIKMYKAEVSDADEWNLSEHFAASDRSLCISWKLKWRIASCVDAFSNLYFAASLNGN